MGEMVVIHTDSGDYAVGAAGSSLRHVCAPGIRRACSSSAGSGRLRQATSVSPRVWPLKFPCEAGGAANRLHMKPVAGGVGAAGIKAAAIVAADSLISYRAHQARDARTPSNPILGVEGRWAT